MKKRLETFLGISGGASMPHSRSGKLRRTKRPLDKDVSTSTSKPANLVAYFQDPDKVWSFNELRQKLNSLPLSAGSYCWYFASIPPGVPTGGCVVHQGLAFEHRSQEHGLAVDGDRAGQLQGPVIGLQDDAAMGDLEPEVDHGTGSRGHLDGGILAGVQVLPPFEMSLCSSRLDDDV